MKVVNILKHFLTFLWILATFSLFFTLRLLLHGDLHVISFTGFDMRMVTAAMALPVVRRVLKMGFTKALVRGAIETKLRASGK